MTASAPVRQEASPDNSRSSGVLDQLLHALNQPLTGLQCSMEVALAAPRTAEQYMQALRDGLELTARMRALVGAIREVADAQPSGGAADAFGLTRLLREVVADVAPVAEAKQIAIAIDGREDQACELGVNRAGLCATVFRLLESVISLAEPGTALRIQAAVEKNTARLRMEWSAAQTAGTILLPELGLLVAQAWFEQMGAQWQRERDGRLDRIAICLCGGAMCDKS
jgi:signal transduction histidine kinase